MHTGDVELVILTKFYGSPPLPDKYFLEVRCAHVTCFGQQNEIENEDCVTFGLGHLRADVHFHTLSLLWKSMQLWRCFMSEAARNAEHLP